MTNPQLTDDTLRAVTDDLNKLIVGQDDDWIVHEFYPIYQRLNLLASELVTRPPWLSEIVNLEAGAKVEVQALSSGEWIDAPFNATGLRDYLDEYGDHPCHGYRLVPLPVKPKTERVPLHKLLGRKTLADGEWLEVRDIAMDFDPSVPDPKWIFQAPDTEWHDIDIADDGTVEVLIEESLQ